MSYTDDDCFDNLDVDYVCDNCEKGYWQSKIPYVCVDCEEIAGRVNCQGCDALFEIEQLTDRVCSPCALADD